MSSYHWIIQGVGIDTSKIRPYIDGEKLARFLYEYCDYNKKLCEVVEETNFGRDEDSVSILLTCSYELEFDDLADLLTYCDDTDSITCLDDGRGNSYFYYPPSMPWEYTKTEPRSLKEVHRRIIRAVKKITSLTDDEIDKMIDNDLYLAGCT